MTTTHLGDLDGLLELGSTGIATLKRGDFLNLGGIVSLSLDANDLTALPADLFEGLDDTLSTLRLDGNDLQTIPAGVFDPLIGLRLLQLSFNDLSSLPPRVFEELTGLLELHLANNPGSARFVPIAKAGPAGGIDVPSGGSVTLGVERPENEPADPWGTNVSYAWAPPAGTTVTYDTGKGANTARPSFTAPAADGTLTFTLTVTGGGGVAATSTVNVRVGATAMGPMPVSAVVDGETLTLTYDRDLQAIDPASVPDSGKGPVYLAVLSAPGARRNIETAAPSAVEVTGRQVVLTLDPPADFGDTVRLSYYPDNAVAASRVRGLGGTLAEGFTGLRVDNDTPEGNTVQSFAVTGPAKTYRIGDTIGIELTFAEAVTVDVTGGAPTLALEIGAVRRKAALCPGLRQRRPHVRIHSGRPGRGGHGRHRGRGERAGGSRRQLHPQHGGSRGGDPAPRPVPRPGVQGGRRAPDRHRCVGRRSDGHGDLVGGAGSGLPAHGRRRVPGADRQRERSGGERGGGVGRDDDAEPGVRDRRRHGERHAGIHAPALWREDQGRGGQRRGGDPARRRAGRDGPPGSTRARGLRARPWWTGRRSP